MRVGVPPPRWSPGGVSARICLVASMPSMTGMRMSISTTSGRCARAAATA